MGYNKGDVIKASEYNELTNRLANEINRRSNNLFTFSAYTGQEDVTAGDPIDLPEHNTVENVLNMSSNQDTVYPYKGSVISISDIVRMLNNLEATKSYNYNAVPSGQHSNYSGGGCHGACVGFCSQTCVNSNSEG